MLIELSLVSERTRQDICQVPSPPISHKIEALGMLSTVGQDRLRVYKKHLLLLGNKRVVQVEFKDEVIVDSQESKW